MDAIPVTEARVYPGLCAGSPRTGSYYYSTKGSQKTLYNIKYLYEIKRIILLLFTFLPADPLPKISSSVSGCPGGAQPSRGGASLPCHHQPASYLVSPLRG